jgi:hypothetical protein
VSGKVLESPEQQLERVIGGRGLDGYSLELSDFKQGRTERETYFNIFLKRDSRLSLHPIIQGLFFMGRGEYIKAWIEFRYAPIAEFPEGSIMIIYGAEPYHLHMETERGLKIGFPPQVTPLGYYLWNNGFRWFKDWYFPEGWMEGSMKLQATRPLDEDVRRERQKKAQVDLGEFIDKLDDHKPTLLEEEALQRARGVLATIP